MIDILHEDGRIVKGVNTTVDVGPDEIKKQAAKFGNKVDKDGHPPTLSKKVKGASTNVAFNLGLTESEEETEYSSEWPFTKPKKKSLKDVDKKVDELDEKWSKKYKRSINCNDPKGFSQKAHCAGRKKKESVEETIRKQGDKYVIYSKDGKKKLGTYNSRKAAEKRLGQIEYFKHKESINESPFSDVSPDVLKRLAMLKNALMPISPEEWSSIIDKELEKAGYTWSNGKFIKENFADGKVKGKSRPGRVKRAGASCNGSVTDLRKRAKNASGEKAKMYHWCANMKSGRKKK